MNNMKSGGEHDMVGSWGLLGWVPEVVNVAVW